MYIIRGYVLTQTARVRRALGYYANSAFTEFTFCLSMLDALARLLQKRNDLFLADKVDGAVKPGEMQR